jgi:hypothetical protein
VRVRQRRLEPFRQRAGRIFDTLLGRRWVKQQRVFLVEAGGLKLKRIEMLDSARASAKEDMLLQLAATGIAPKLVARHHRDLWLEFIDGERVDPADPRLPDDFAKLLSALYGSGATVTAPRGIYAPEAVERDLALLVKAGALPVETAEKVAALLPTVVPRTLWIGLDHTDLLARNMLRRSDGSLCLIDIESIVSGEAVGTGFAKACIRWIGPARERYVEAVRRRSEIPGFLAYLPYLEIRFLASWSKRSLLLGKEKLLEPRLIDAWIERTAAGRSAG